MNLGQPSTSSQPEAAEKEFRVFRVNSVGICAKSNDRPAFMNARDGGKSLTSLENGCRETLRRGCFSPAIHQRTPIEDGLNRTAAADLKFNSAGRFGLSLVPARSTSRINGLLSIAAGNRDAERPVGRSHGDRGNEGESGDSDRQAVMSRWSAPRPARGRS